jgi:hypothetical protein
MDMARDVASRDAVKRAIVPSVLTKLPENGTASTWGRNPVPRPFFRPFQELDRRRLGRGRAIDRKARQEGRGYRNRFMWRPISTAPYDGDLRLAVLDDSGHAHALVFRGEETSNPSYCAAQKISPLALG